MASRSPNFQLNPPKSNPMNGIFWHVLMFSICQHTLHFNIFYILQTEILLIFVPIFLFVSVFLVLHFEKKLKPFSLYQFSPLVESFEHRIFLPLNSEKSNIWRWWTLSTSFSPLGLGQSIYLKRLPFQIVQRERVADECVKHETASPTQFFILKLVSFLN